MYTFELFGSTMRLQLADKVDTGYKERVCDQSGDFKRIREEAIFA
jgi:hypothetical protein